MVRRLWPVALGIGTLAGLVTALFGVHAQQVELTWGLVICALCVTASVRKWCPPQKAPWYALAFAALCYFGVYGLDLLFPTPSNGEQASFRLPDFLSQLGYLTAIASAYRMGRLRADAKDPTNVIDALIVTAGLGVIVWAAIYVPIMRSHLDSSVKLEACIFSGYDLLMFFVVSRVIIGPGVKNASYYLLGLVAIDFVITDNIVALDQASIHFLGQQVLIMLCPALGTAALTAAAVNPTMARLLESKHAEPGHMTTRRLLYMTVAVLIPPVILLFEPAKDVRWIVPYWVIITALVMVRFAGLIRARDRLAEDLHRRRHDRRFRSLIEGSNDVIIVLDDQGQPSFSSPSAERLLGHLPDTAAILRNVHADDRQPLRALISQTKTNGRINPIECRFMDASTVIRWFEVAATDMRHDPDIAGIVLNVHEVTERKLLEEDLRHKVLHDDLTGIANRVLLRDRVEHALHQRRDPGQVFALLFIDLDDFKTVNDGLGHAAGDELLKVVAFRLETFLRAGDTAARLGGDEFSVVLQSVASKSAAEEIAARLLEAVQQPVYFEEREISVGASIGIAFAEDGTTSEVLLRNADIAMYNAKWGGKQGVRIFDKAMYENAFERLELKGDLLHALERNELSLFYQPIIALANGDIDGVEALLRWHHPTRGFVSPDTFIPLAEENGLIVPIGEWVIEQALRQLAFWNDASPDRTITMSINVSPRQLADAGIVTTIKHLLSETQVDPGAVTLELTETAVLSETEGSERLRAIHDLGVRIAADDFGTGFASYAALQMLPFSTVKIDQSLIRGLSTSDGRAEAQVQSIIEMSHLTGLTVVAEGIEDSTQRDALVTMGCDRVQGFFFGRPAPVTQTNELMIYGARS